MISFQKIWENMQAEKQLPEDDKSLLAVRNGIGINSDFWEDFLLVINNSDVAELLDVPMSKISDWRSKIIETLDRIKEIDSNSEPSVNKKLLKTGTIENI